MRRATFTVASVVLCASCASSPLDSTDTTQPTSSTEASSIEPAATTTATTTAVSSTIDRDALAAIVEAFVGDEAGGADVLIRRDGDEARFSSGIASNGGDELTTGQPFRVGSISKPLVATMVMQLVDEGRIDLDDTLNTHFPDALVGGDATIRQLLSHQSGVPSYTDQPEMFGATLGDRSRLFTADEMLAYVIDVDPGAANRFSYSNSNYLVLGQLVEALDGSDLNSSLAARITEPLRLDDTFFDTGDDPLPDDLAAGWSSLTSDGEPDAPYASIVSSAWAAGALVSTTNDLAGFLTALVSGALVSPTSFAEMADTLETGYGLGVSRAVFSITQVGVGHSGSIFGFSSTMAIDPESGDLLVVLTNNDALIADVLAADILQAG